MELNYKHQTLKTLRKLSKNDCTLTRLARSSRSWRSPFTEPVDFSSLRKTMGDSGLLAIESPCTTESPVIAISSEPEMTLEKITAKNQRAKKLRRYIVVEAVYQNSGQIAPLDKIIKLKEKYRFRVLLDESNSIGVLGHSGRGLTEYCRVPIEKIDIVTASMGHALATEGGFCTGSARVIDHQRLSSSGYVFSASLPPYLARKSKDWKDYKHHI
ncbi:hypothetical protein V6N11_064859 [Hibiscus sabdariffa]|uniref:Uncharacterized protein n=2 Tax=Hibiscus sabdariffa TaxID=183260 RepID=A0ABR2SI45_9ROSI